MDNTVSTSSENTSTETVSSETENSSSSDTPSLDSSQVSSNDNSYESESTVTLPNGIKYIQGKDLPLSSSVNPVN